jgi:diguanylate cyclase (GGDEF)-like protein
MKKRWRKYYDQLELLMDFSDVGWWIIDYENDSEHFICNDKLCEMFELDPNETHHSIAVSCPIAGEYNHNVKKEDAEAAKKIVNDYHKLLRGENDHYINEFPYRYSDGSVRYFKSRAKVLEWNPGGSVAVMFGIITDVTRQAELHKALDRQKSEFQKLSETDSLTGLMNRRKFMELYEYACAHARRQSHAIGVFMMDIDSFKSFNDIYGHLAGDDCLVSVATALSEVFQRKSDMVARFGGEEFIAFVPDATSKEMYRLANELVESISNLNIMHRGSADFGRVTLSVGGCIGDMQKSHAYALIKYADRMLYEAKESGRNRYRIA